VTKKQPDQIDAPSRDGAFIHGLTLEGCRWDDKVGQPHVIPVMHACNAATSSLRLLCVQISPLKLEWHILKQDG
jgi:hypothetical protein